MTMFVIIIGVAFGSSDPIGPFPHEEDAKAYAHEHVKHTIWRVQRLKAPEGEKKA